MLCLELDQRIMASTVFNKMAHLVHSTTSLGQASKPKILIYCLLQRTLHGTKTWHILYPKYSDESLMTQINLAGKI